MTEQALNLIYIAVDVVQAMLICEFLIRFTGAQRRPLYYIVIGVLFTLLDFLIVYAQIGNVLNYLLVFLLLFLSCLLLMKRTAVQSVTSALVVLLIISVLGNINASVIIIASDALPVQSVVVIGNVYLAVSVIVLWLLLRYIANYFSFVREEGFPYLFTLWLPLIMIFVFSEAFSWAMSGNVVIVDEQGYGHMQSQLDISGWWGVFIFVFALICIIVLFFSYQKFRSSYARQEQALQFEQELAWQKTAMEEAVLRYDNTRAFRHDLNNHLAVLSGLIRDGNQAEAKGYLEKIAGATDMLSPELHSGNPVLDVLLSEKVTVAKQAGIRIICQADVGKTTIDDYDLCILIGNALDNAIKACGTVPPDQKFIDIETTHKKDFLYLKIANSKNDDGRKGQGYGLRNMRAVAVKYNGSMETSGQKDTFELSVILSIPLHQ